MGETPKPAFTWRLMLVPSIGAAMFLGCADEPSPPVGGEVAIADADCNTPTIADLLDQQDPAEFTEQVQPIDTEIQIDLCRKLRDGAQAVVDVYNDRDNQDVDPSFELNNNEVEVGYRRNEESGILYATAIFATDETGSEPDLGQPRGLKIVEIRTEQNEHGRITSREMMHISFDAGTGRCTYDSREPDSSGTPTSFTYSGPSTFEADTGLPPTIENFDAVQTLIARQPLYAAVAG